MPIAQQINGALRRVPVWAVYLVGALPPLWYFWLGLTGALGPEPITALERELGLLGLKMLIVVLAVTPLRKATGLNLLRFRRALGLLVFYYILWHLSVWLLLDIRDPGRIWADIVKRPYITIGMLGFVALVPLAVTSNNLSLRKMGAAAWRRLHKLTYAAAVLGGLHFVMLVKGWQIRPLVYLGIVLLLLALRIRPARRRAVATSA